MYSEGTNNSNNNSRSSKKCVAKKEIQLIKTRRWQKMETKKKNENINGWMNGWMNGAGILVFEIQCNGIRRKLNYSSLSTSEAFVDNTSRSKCVCVCAPRSFLFYHFTWPTTSEFGIW